MIDRYPASVSEASDMVAYDILRQIEGSGDLRHPGSVITQVGKDLNADLVRQGFHQPGIYESARSAVIRGRRFIGPHAHSPLLGRGKALMSTHHRYLPLRLSVTILRTPKG